METKFKAFITKDRTKFLSVGESGVIIETDTPIDTFLPNTDLDVLKKFLYFGSSEERDEFFSKSELVLFTLKEEYIPPKLCPGYVESCGSFKLNSNFCPDCSHFCSSGC